MPRYSYSAVSLSGEQITGEYAAPDQGGVTAMLRQGGYYPLRISERRESGASRAKVPIKTLANFCTQMSAMLRAGVPIAKTLEILKDQTENKGLRKILEDIYAAVQRGNSLSEALQPHVHRFPDLFLSMIEAGEASGTLDLCLERAATAFSRTSRLNSKIRNAMIYPCIILVVLVGLLVAMLVFVIPAFAEMYAGAGADLPAFTRGLLVISGFVQRRWFIPLGIIVGLVVAFRLWLASDKGRTAFDRFKFRAPAVRRLLDKIYAARFSRTLSSLSSAGVPLTQALGVTARSIVNRHMEKKIYAAVEAINNGAELSGQLERMGLLPPMIVYMTRLGEESGTMDSLLMQAADFYDEETDSAMQAFTAILEPALIISMAVIVLPVLLGVLMPMFGMFELLL